MFLVLTLGKVEDEKKLALFFGAQTFSAFSTCLAVCLFAFSIAEHTHKDDNDDK